jgi:hypothetical protein
LGLHGRSHAGTLLFSDPAVYRTAAGTHAAVPCAGTRPGREPVRGFEVRDDWPVVSSDEPLEVADAPLFGKLLPFQYTEKMMIF